MNTDYNLYKIFLYLFEEKSISKTASKLYVSQPAISYSLKELENQLGYTLFYRNSKGIEPTTEAKELYSYISTAFTILKDAEEHIKNLNNLNIGCIRIGVPSYLGSFFLADVIQEFHKTYPGIQFEILEDSVPNMSEMLETRKLDLAFGPLPIDAKKNVEKITLSKYKNCFAYYKDTFSNGSINKLEGLSKVPVLLPNKSSSIRLKLDELLESKNMTFNVLMEIGSVDTLLEMTRRGLGIGYFTENIISAQKDADHFEIIKLSEELPATDICCLYMEDFLTAGARKFVEMIKSVLKK